MGGLVRVDAFYCSPDDGRLKRQRNPTALYFSRRPSTGVIGVRFLVRRGEVTVEIQGAYG